MGENLLSKSSILNVTIGFWTIFFAACGGTFLATQSHQAFVHDVSLLSSWQFTLMKSAHTHTNLFGILHILLGMTLPIAKLNKNQATGMTLGFFCGTLAMSVLLIIRSFHMPLVTFDWLGVVNGCLLSCALVAILWYCIQLTKRCMK